MPTDRILTGRCGMTLVGVNGHSRFPHLRSSKTPPPLVDHNEETSAGGRCGQDVCGLSKSLWARLRVHNAGSVHGPPLAHVPAVVGLTTLDFSLSFSRYESSRMLIVVDRVIGGVSGDAHERALDRGEQIEGGGRIITRRLGQRVDEDHA